MGFDVGLVVKGAGFIGKAVPAVARWAEERWPVVVSIGEAPGFDFLDQEDRLVFRLENVSRKEVVLTALGVQVGELAVPIPYGPTTFANPGFRGFPHRLERGTKCWLAVPPVDLARVLWERGARNSVKLRAYCIVRREAGTRELFSGWLLYTVRPRKLQVPEFVARPGR